MSYLIYYEHGDIQGSSKINIGHVDNIEDCLSLISELKKKYPKGFNKKNNPKKIYGVTMYFDCGEFYYEEIKLIKVQKEKKIMNKEPEKETCRRCKNEPNDLHTCPYASDIYGDNETLCNCCDDCQHECCMDI